MDQTEIPLEGRMIPLSVRRHRGARRISLRLSPARDGIVMTLPVRASFASAMRFFHSKAGWVLANVETGKNVAFDDGVTIPVLGKDYVIRRREGRGVSQLLPEGALQVHGAPEFTARRVRDFLKKQLRGFCAMRATELATQLGKKVREVRIRDMRSRWGSCARDGTLAFHWQLVFAPPAILEYLIVHEVAHLREMNHGPRFWRLVADLYSEHAMARKWLRQQGHRLHRYGR